MSAYNRALPVKTGAGHLLLDAFGGIDRRKSAGNGALRWAVDLTAEGLPLLRTRPERYYFSGPSDSAGAFAVGDLLLIPTEAGILWAYGGDGNARSYSGLVPEYASRRRFAAMGSRVLIWPDKAMWTAEGGIVPLGASYTAAGLVFSDGTYAGEAAEKNTVTVPEGAGPFPFRVGDAVTFPACEPTGGEEVTLILREIGQEGKELRFYENSFAGNGTVAESLTLERRVPDLDYICANENRIWGCKGDTVWCCKLGDPSNWYVFDGVSTDAWSVESGTAGEFTGCVSYLGYPCFFKEDRIFKVYGSKPVNFELLGSATLGVLPGADRTMAVAGEALFYLSRAGFVKYNGGMPVPVGEALGELRFTGGLAGSDGLRYYVSAETAEGGKLLLVYDTRFQAWHCESGPELVGMAWRSGLWAVGDNDMARSLGAVLRVPTGAQTETLPEASAEFADFDFRSFDGKYPVRLWIRAETENGIEIEVKYDSANAWEELGSVPAGGKAAKYLAFPVRRCDRFALRLTGAGPWTVWALEIECRAESTARK